MFPHYIHRTLTGYCQSCSPDPAVFGPRPTLQGLPAAICWCSCPAFLLFESSCSSFFLPPNSLGFFDKKATPRRTVLIITSVNPYLPHSFCQPSCVVRPTSSPLTRQSQTSCRSRTADKQIPRTSTSQEILPLPPKRYGKHIYCDPVPSLAKCPKSLIIEGNRSQSLCVPSPSPASKSYGPAKVQATASSPARELRQPAMTGAKVSLSNRIDRQNPTATFANRPFIFRFASPGGSPRLDAGANFLISMTRHL